MKILIVEDDAVIAMVAQEVLADYGHVVLGPARTAPDALRIAQDNPPDLALVDIALYGPKDGIALAKTLQERSIPCIFVSGQAALAYANRDAAMAYFPKPYQLTDLEQSARLVRAIADGNHLMPSTIPAGLDIFSLQRIPQRPPCQSAPGNR